jgi:hypothetical protein
LASGDGLVTAGAVHSAVIAAGANLIQAIDALARATGPGDEACTAARVP